MGSDWRVVNREGSQSDLHLRMTYKGRFGGVDWRRRGQAKQPVRGPGIVQVGKPSLIQGRGRSLSRYEYLWA